MERSRRTPLTTLAIAIAVTALLAFGIAATATSSNAIAADISDLAAGGAELTAQSSANVVKMNRLYNPNSGEHFYTADLSEKSTLVSLGWHDEGVGWYTPVQGHDVYRMYNPNAGDHHYTMDAAERNSLIAVGWNYEGVGWKSDPLEQVPLYREYNPNAIAGAHNYTTMLEEHRYLISLGWRDEGTAWYGVPKPSESDDPTPSPDPSPNPEPSPNPNPAPTPDPDPQPDPNPDPNPTPNPDPTPDPGPIASDSLTVIFMPNGASGTMANQSIPRNTIANLTANAFTRNGYAFKGWNTSPDGNGTSFANEGSMSARGQDTTVTLYAQWKAQPTTITFDGNGGWGVMDGQSVEFGTSYALNYNSFRRTGHTFQGWNTRADGNGTPYANGALFTATKPGETLTLYAQWSPHPTTVYFSSNGGTGTMASLSVPYGSSVRLTSNAFSRTNYSFASWNTTAQGDGNRYDDKALFTATTPGATVRLYAQWSANYQIVLFDANGGQGAMESISVPYGTSVHLPTNTFTRNGWSFDSWTTRLYGDQTYEDGGLFTATKPGETTTLYAQWNANPVTIVYNANGGQGTMADQIIPYHLFSAELTKNTFVKNGALFHNWNTKPDGTGAIYLDEGPLSFTTPGETITLYAQWFEGPMTVRFNSNGGTGTMSNQEIQYGTTSALKTNSFTKSGFSFAGWNTQADGTGTSYADNASITPSMPGISMTLYAQWADHPTTVTFNANGGTGSMTNQYVSYNTTAKLNANTFTRSGYTFSGWNTKADGTGTSYADKGNVSASTSNGTISLYAQWSPNPLTISFVANGGAGSMTDQTIAYNATANLKANTFTRSNYTFSGWNTKANGSGTSYADKRSITASTPGQTLTLYAQWTATSGWRTVSGKDYYYINGVKCTSTNDVNCSSGNGHPAGYRCFDQNGAVITGWKNNKYYNPNNDGVRVSGHFEVPHSGGSNWYYFNTSTGVRVTNTWVDNRYFGSDGVRYSGMKSVPNGDGTSNWYYFNTSTGIRATNIWYQNRYFGSDGVRYSGERSVPNGDGTSNWYYFNTSTGVRVTNTWYQNKYFGSDGVRFSGVKNVPNGDGTYNKYYFDSSTGIRKLDVVSGDYWFRSSDGVGFRYDSWEYAEAVLAEYNNYRMNVATSGGRYYVTPNPGYHDMATSSAVEAARRTAANGVWDNRVHNIRERDPNVSDILAYSGGYLMTPSELINAWRKSTNHRKMMQCDTTGVASFGAYYDSGSRRYYYSLCYNFSGTNYAGN